ncbi:PREDICTED: CD109 antigen-like [Priapulus caudatus]|uniref:CD109 antigen-like n=1 Tax=Priapulus caudatus TaxID=37621 RepID=A0ABM1ENZ9_PRICU|nr:PREDICTED: CD109 antigen-like [Priapulus caudatus]
MTESFSCCCIYLLARSLDNVGGFVFQGEAVKKSFTVDEYVLPKFEVTVDVPTYYYGTKIMATGKVGAKYTYGKSVAGTAVVALTVPSGYQQQEKKYEQTVELGANGKADFSFELELGEQRLWQPLSFEATVTEALTGISLKGAASAPVYQHDVKLEWEGSQYFKPGLKYSAYARHSEAENSGFFTAQAFTAQSETFLQLTLDKEKVEVGSPLPLVVTVNSTVPIDQLTYQVVCKGNVVLASALIMGGLTTSTLTLAVTTQMAPESRLFAYYVHEGELIADGVMFSVDGAFQNQVEVEFSQTQALPGKQVEVQVYTNPDSFIGLLAVDQSVQLLKSGNDITQEEVVEELSTYGGGGGAGGRPVPLLRGGRVVRRKRSFLPWYFNSGSASSVIRDAGLLVLTDALIYKDSPDYYDCPNCEMEMFAVARADGGAPRRNVKMKSAVADDGGATTVETEEGAHVRKLFPETWLWVNASTPSDSGTTTVMATVPDTITSWLASAISMNEKHGLGITEHTTTLTAFQPFFVSLTLPYSVLRGEVLVLQATVFNYMNADTQVEVTLDHSDDFENVPEEAESDADAAQVKRGQVSLGAPRFTYTSQQDPNMPIVFEHLMPQTRQHISSSSTALQPQSPVWRYPQPRPERPQETPRSTSAPYLNNMGASPYSPDNPLDKERDID